MDWPRMFRKKEAVEEIDREVLSRFFEKNGWSEQVREVRVDERGELVPYETYVISLRKLAAQFARSVASAYPQVLGLGEPGKVSLRSEQEYVSDGGGMELIRKHRTPRRIEPYKRYVETSFRVVRGADAQMRGGRKGKILISTPSLHQIYPAWIADEFFELAGKVGDKK